MTGQQPGLAPWPVPLHAEFHVSMSVSEPKDLSRFFLAGINYKKADTSLRGQFALNELQYEQLLREAEKEGLDELFVISTCNRTEIYGFAPSSKRLSQLLCRVTLGDHANFEQIAYHHHGEQAVQHLYHVACGLDSQILGDYEVISQVKQAARFAKERGFLGTFTERMLNSVFQVSKHIKNETSLSSGTVSVAYAAVQFLKTIPGILDKEILLVGMGKIGRNACCNLMDVLGTRQVTLVNRTESVAREFAAQHGLKCLPMEQLPEALVQADVVIVATNAPEPTIHCGMLEQSGRDRIILDLSIPHNVDPASRQLKGVTLVNVDELSRVQDQTLDMRIQEVPLAQQIIREHMQDFLYWYRMRNHAVILQEVKNRLARIHEKEIRSLRGKSELHPEDIEEFSSRIVQKVINLFAGKVRQANGKSEHYLEMLSELFETPLNETA